MNETRKVLDEIYTRVHYINENISNLERMGKVLKYQMELSTLLSEIEEDLKSKFE